jgi:hypothetical protein
MERRPNKAGQGWRSHRVAVTLMRLNGQSNISGAASMQAKRRIEPFQSGFLHNLKSRSHCTIEAHGTARPLPRLSRYTSAFIGTRIGDPPFLRVLVKRIDNPRSF